jgi:hypothetical protein
MSTEHDDLLSRAARSLQEETEGPSSAARFTRLRVMASLRETQVKRRTQTVLLLPFAACLAATAAWGMAAGVVPDIRSSITRALGIDPPPEPAPPPKPKPAPRKPPLQRAPEAPAPLENAVPAPPPAPIEELAPEPSVRPAPARILTIDPRKHPKTAASDPAHELYRAAHEAHFVAHDCARALAGWEAYLRAAPSGQLAVEARYNRALCLVRLGRSEQARSALEPFARGSAGSYRQREAAGLLEVLGEK